MDVITRHRLEQLDLDESRLAGLDLRERLDALYGRFLARIPYENLSNQQACRACPDDPEQWPRTTDRLLRENAEGGFGGTSFSLAYALRDLQRGLGANAHCALGRNLVTEEAHAVVLVFLDEGPLLYDPALLVGGAVPVHPDGCFADPLGPVALRSCRGSSLTLAVAMRGEPARDVYALVPMPVQPQAFRQAWIASFYRGRRRPLCLARRDGCEITRYVEGADVIEILRPDGTRRHPVGPRPAAELHRHFGLPRACLEAFFADGRDASDG